MRARHTDDTPVAGSDNQSTDTGSDQDGDEDKGSASPTIESSMAAVGSITVAGTTISVGESPAVLGPATVTVKSVGDSSAVLGSATSTDSAVSSISAID